MTTPFERDIGDQAEALLAFSQSATPPALTRLLRGQYDRVVLTGMGSSHFAALPSWRRLVDAGYPAWWVDTGQLLDSPRLITPGTLLVATSQSGASAEIVAMLESRTPSRERPPSSPSPTTRQARSPGKRDALMPLHSGGEATVSTKSYLNSLAAHLRIASLLTAGPSQDAADAVKVVDEFSPSSLLHAAAADLTASSRWAPGLHRLRRPQRDRAIRRPYHQGSCEDSRRGIRRRPVPARPARTRRPGLTAVLFGGDAPVNPSLCQLGRDLLASGSAVLAVGDLDLAGATRSPRPPAMPWLSLLTAPSSLSTSASRSPEPRASPPAPSPTAVRSLLLYECSRAARRTRDGDSRSRPRRNRHPDCRARQ